jgi:hypothetical protein
MGRLSVSGVRLGRRVSQDEPEWAVIARTRHGLVAEQRLRHPGVAELDRHVANAVAKPTPRGWRLV